jgi:hypothetical protein
VEHRLAAFERRSEVAVIAEVPLAELHTRGRVITSPVSNPTEHPDEVTVLHEGSKNVAPQKAGSAKQERPAPYPVTAHWIALEVL